MASIQIVATSITSDDMPKMTCIRSWSRQVFSVAGMARLLASAATPNLSAAHASSDWPRQKFKKYSGIAIMYFKLNDQRSTILIGSAIMNSSRLVSTM